MAADSEEKVIKRRKKANEKKLLPGEEVEVLFLDEGFAGSWHGGILIGCGIKCRRIEFTNLLNDDNRSKFVEWITVSAAIEGDSRSTTKDYRGSIRPVPPLHDIQVSEIRYGLCVDALINDAWWEGVVFDNEEGSADRVIFFPDLGDQQRITIDQLRLTQEWNEVSGHWKLRGEWMLLQVLESYKQEDALPVSIREIWYDLRTTDAFVEKIGVWTSGSQPIWHKLVSELIQELLSVANGLPFAGLDLSNQLIDAPMTSDDIGGQDVLCPEGTDFQLDGAESSSQGMYVDDYCFIGLTGNKVGEAGVYFSALSDFIFECHDRDAPRAPDSRPRFIDKCRVAESHLLAPGWEFENNSYVSPDGEHYSTFIEACEARKAVEENSAVKNIMNHGGDNSNLVCNNQGTEPNSNFEEHRDHKSESCSASTVAESWKPVKLQAENCSDFASVCQSYIEHGKPHSKISKIAAYSQTRLKLKKYLLLQGWRIESKIDTITRFRYVSPERKTYYSLYKVCCDLIKGQQKNCKYKDDNSLGGGHSGSNIREMLPLKVHPEPVSFASDRLENSWPVMGDKNHTDHSGSDVGLLAVKEGAVSNNEHTQEFRNISEMVDSDGLLDYNIMVASSPEVIEELACTDGSTSGNQAIVSKEVFVNEGLKPVYLPEAITKYVDCIETKKQNKQNFSSATVRLLTNNAKEHLKLTGWSLWMKYKKTKHELCYTSPNDENYYSLYTACKAYLEAGYQNISTVKSTKSIDMSKKIESLPIDAEFDNSIKMNTNCRPRSLSTAVNSIDFQEAAQILQEGAEKGSRFPSFPNAALCNRSLRQSSGKSSNHQQIKRRKIQTYISQGNGSSSSFSPYVLRSSKRSRLVRAPSQHIAKTILSWLIDKDVILPRQKVSYIRKRDGRAMKDGRVTRHGIKCNCCSKVFSLANFEAHAGGITRRPAASIFLRDGKSLLQCQMQIVHANKSKYFPHARLKSNYSHYESDSKCSVCCYGGYIMLCDHCPSSFHPGCVGLEDVPEGKWCCPSCRCRICGLSEFNCDTDQFTEKSVLYCDQCEREYHVSCLRKRGSLQLRSCPTGDWVCSKNCSKIFYCLRKLLGKPNPTSVEGLSWTILRSSRENGGKFDDETIAEHHSKLYIALDVLHECFVTVIESRTQSDLVADLLFNRVSELNRLNFWGFYTVILERGDEIISVATFRVYGEKVAEMPFIGTRFQFRRQGMCRLLVDKLEKLLSALGVERLVLPAVPQLLQTWTTSFGFTQLTNSDRLELSEYTLLSFEDTTMCQKFLRTPPSILKEPTGNCNRSSRSTQQTDNDNNSVASEIMEMVEPVGKSASPGVETYTLPGVGDSVKENSYQLDATHSLLVVSCTNPVGQTEQNEDNDKISGSVCPGRCEGSFLVEASPAIAVKPRSELKYKLSGKIYEHIGNTSSGRGHLVKDLGVITTSSFKYVYKRRALANM